MSISSKHHYIPQFFLNGFTDQTGLFYVYDKQRDVIKSKKFHPSTHFFEKNRNSILVNGEFDDGPEQAYQISEDSDKNIVKRIQQHDGLLTLNLEEMFVLQKFLSNLFFRLPVIDDVVDRYLRNADYKKELMFHIKDSKGNAVPDEIMKQIQTDNKFISLYRPLLGTIIFVKSKHTTDHNNWRIAYNANQTNLISDNPLIFKDLKTLDFFENPFVFPLSSKYKLIRTEKEVTGKLLSAKFVLLSEVMTIHQSQKFVCCSSKEHLENMVQASRMFPAITAREMVFSELEKR